MDKQVETAVKACVTFQLHDKLSVTLTTPLQSVSYPTHAWEKVAIDIMGPFNAASADCHFVVTLVDYYSKWPKIAFVSHPTTQAVMQFLSTVFSREGIPRELISDNGVQFTSHNFKCSWKTEESYTRHNLCIYQEQTGRSMLQSQLKSMVYKLLHWKEEGGRSSRKTFSAGILAVSHATTPCTPTELLHGRAMLNQT